MISYFIRRFIKMLFIFFAISLIAFTIIQLPPGDYLNTYAINLQAQGEELSADEIENLRRAYGFGEPLLTQYTKWISNFVTGDFGFSFSFQKPVSDVIESRMMITILVTLATTVFVWIASFAIGLYSAINQYSFGDYLFTFVGFIGLAIPNFVLALLIMWVASRYLDLPVGGLFSPEYITADWSWAKFVDLLKHLWVPLIVLGTAETAALIRVFRATLLDQLHQPYVETARAKGMPYGQTVIKYPVRIALVPFVATVGWTLPTLISGATITAIVLNLPMNGPVLLQSLLNQDMHLAASFIMLESALVLVGTLISDVLLAAMDPRIQAT